MFCNKIFIIKFTSINGYTATAITLKVDNKLDQYDNTYADHV